MGHYSDRPLNPSTAMPFSLLFPACSRPAFRHKGQKSGTSFKHTQILIQLHQDFADANTNADTHTNIYDKYSYRYPEIQTQISSYTDGDTAASRVLKRRCPYRYPGQISIQIPRITTVRTLCLDNPSVFLTHRWEVNLCRGLPFILFHALALCF